MGCAASQDQLPLAEGKATVSDGQKTGSSAVKEGVTPGSTAAVPVTVETGATIPDPAGGQLKPKEESKSQPPTAAPSSDKPRPMPFAIMRNGHEVLRGGMQDCAAALEAGRITDFLQAWRAFQRWTVLHARMEEGVEGAGRGFFPLLNLHFDSIADPLLLTHKTIDELEGAVDAAARAVEGSADEADLIAALKEAFAKFAEANEAHLAKEEEIMMPKVMELGKSGHNLKALMTEDLLPCVPAQDMPFFLEHAMQTLEQHSAGQPRARVFAHAIYAVATKEQWMDWKSHVQKGLSSELYDSIAKECGFES